MIIKAELAQRIVDNIMPLVHQNINIMDNSGLIIASGNKDRLNTCHQGAVEVIRSSREVEVFPENLERFPGALPGLNWPIILGSQIVGVVGISGHPDLVRNTAQIVKMVTELLLERENLTEEYRANLQLREQFLQLLLADNDQETLLKIAKIAKLLRFDLTLPRLAAVIPVDLIIQEAFSQYGAHDLVVARTRETITKQLEDSDLIESHRDLFIFTEEDLVILKYFPAGTQPAVCCEWGGNLLTLLDSGHDNRDLCIGLGSITSTAELQESYKEAQFSQKNRPNNNRAAAISDFDILAAYLLREPGALAYCLALKNLRNIVQDKLDCKYDMQNTVSTLLVNNLNVSGTAKAMFIHRNTLVFRLEKLKELTGLCPCQSLNHAILCKLLFG
ncbi:MAG: transcriptional regulator, CdaR [Firmicutes bacterium]|nr:transcriptional regulator, CdaR [Bacillota bacterium]